LEAANITANLKAKEEIDAVKLAAANLDLETAAVKSDAEKKAAENPDKNDANSKNDSGSESKEKCFSLLTCVK
jgi:hypothetical protein